MSIDAVGTIINSGVQVILLASLPSVGLGLCVGLFIAILQAVTQIQEQTLTFVPKMIAVLTVLGATFPWIARIVLELAMNLWRNIPMYVQ